MSCLFSGFTYLKKSLLFTRLRSKFFEVIKSEFSKFMASFLEKKIHMLVSIKYSGTMH